MQKSSGNISRSDYAFYFWHAAVPLVFFALLILTVELTDLDRRATELFYDASIRVFPLREAWLLQTVEHVGAKRAVILLAVLVVVAWLASHGMALLKAFRPLLVFIFVGMALCVLSVSTLKNSSTQYCPCLWSAAVCWFVTLALYDALLRRRPIPSVSSSSTTPNQAA